MLKLFSKYNKWFLIVIMSVLMLAFLIQPTMSLLMPDPAKAVAGTLANGKSLRNSDISAGEGSLRIVERVNRMEVPRLVEAAGYDLSSPEGQYIAGQLLQERSFIIGDSGLRWKLMLIDAQSNLGINVSSGLVNQRLVEILGSDNWNDDETVNRGTAQRAFDVPAAYLRSAVREMMIIEAYREEIAPGPAQVSMSEPLRERLVADNLSRVNGTMTIITALRSVDGVPEPSEERLESTYQTYRDNAPRSDGRFGYRYPDRVKLEYLVVTPELVSGLVTAPSAVEIKAYYDQNAAAFGSQSEYDARAAIVQVLRQNEASNLARRIVDRGRDILDRALIANENATRTEAYYAFTDDYVPMPLIDVANQLAEEFGVRPLISTPGLATSWTPIAELTAEPVIGDMEYRADPSRPGVPLINYLAAAREIEPDDNNPLVNFRLQAHVPSLRLMAKRPQLGLEGLGGFGLEDPTQPDPITYGIVRLVDGQPSQAPATRAEVQALVRNDARLDMAYERLLAEVDTWSNRADDMGLESLAEQFGLGNMPFSTARRELSVQQLQVPEVPPLGRKAAFVDGVFDAVYANDGEPGATGLVTLDEDRAVVLFRVDQVDTVTQNMYRFAIGDPNFNRALGSVLTGGRTNPLSEEAVAARVGWEPKDRPDEMEAGSEDESADADASDDA